MIAAEDGPHGWIYFNEDAGIEFSRNHPIESGEVPDAIAIRPCSEDERVWIDEANRQASKVQRMREQIKRLQFALRGGTATSSNAEMMDWVADRLVHVHGENPNVDYVRALRERAQMLRDADRAA